MATSIIKSEALSFEELKEQGLAYVQSLPADVTWKDAYLSSEGSILLDLMSGYSAWNAFKFMNNRKEKYLSEASLRTSIIELAQSKGIFLPPASPLVISCTVTPNVSVILEKGEMFGYLGSYNLYPIERCELVKDTARTIQLAVGFMEETTITPNTTTDFYETSISSSHQYATSIVESLIVNSVTVLDPIYTVNSLQSKADMSTNVLRYVDDYSVNITFGNGTLGYQAQINQNIVYKTLFYDDSVDTIDMTSFSSPYGDMSGITTVTKADKYLSTENLRLTAKYTSINGVLVSTSHYESAVRQAFGNYYYDVVVEDTYPSDTIHLLPSYLYTDAIHAKLQAYINMRKGTAVKIDYDIIPSSRAVDISIGLDYITTVTKSEVESVVYDFLNQYMNQIVDEDNYVMNLSELITELNKYSPSSMKFYLTPTSNSISISIPKWNYIRNFTFTLAGK
jgi:hypothetical protein